MASPSLGECIPVSMLIAVVFPAPLCPRIVNISFYLIEIFKRSTAVFSPNLLDRLFIRIGSLGL